MKKNLSKITLSCVLIYQAVAVQAHQPYQATVTVGSTSAHVAEPNLRDLSSALRTTSLELLIPTYTPVTPVSIGIDLRGIDTLTSFAADSTVLVVEIPQAGIVETFSGATRDDSILLYKEFLRDGGTKHKLLRAYAKYSPIDPIAGNPNSLMAQMAQSDYLLGRLSPLSGCECGWSAQPILHQFQVGLNAGRAFSKEFDTSTVSPNIRYSYSPDSERALVIDAPFTYIRNGGASSLFGSLGFAFRLPVTHNWSLTSTVRAGFGGSLDLCTSGVFLSTGVMSTYQYEMFDCVLAMTNYAGYFTSTNLWLSGVNFNYNLHNYVFKNGLSLTTCKGFAVCERPVNMSVSIIDSYFTGQRLYMQHYDEIGVSLITTHVNPYIDYDCLSLGFSYQFGEQSYTGYVLNMAYQF